MDPEDFTLLYQDTAAANWDMGSCGSQTTFNSGRAILAAAADVRDQLLDAAAAELEADREDLELADGRVRVKGSPDRSVSIADLAARRHHPREGLGRGPGGAHGRHRRLRGPSGERDVPGSATDHAGGAREGGSRDRRGARAEGGRGPRLRRDPQPDGRGRPGHRRRRDGGRPRALGGDAARRRGPPEEPAPPRLQARHVLRRPGDRGRLGADPDGRARARAAPRAWASPRRSPPPARSRTRSRRWWAPRSATCR